MFLSVSPAYEEGRIVGAASIARDNTEHKRLEELSRLYTKRLELIHEMDQKILQHASGRECAQFVVRQLVPMARLSRVTITVIDFDARIAHGIVSYAKGEFNDGVDYPLDPLITPHNDRESSARNSIDPRRLRLAASLRIGKAARG